MSETEDLLAQQTSRESTAYEPNAGAECLSDQLLGEKQHQHRDFPGFKKHHAAAPIELFYDLFFVANLKTFTAIHKINDVLSTDRCPPTWVAANPED